MIEFDPSSLDISHHFGGGVYAKETRIRAGHVLVSHRHEFDHLSIIASGFAHITHEHCKEQTIAGPAVVLIKAGALHRVKALTDVVWYCIHATQETDPVKADKVLIRPDSAIDELRAFGVA